MSSDLQFNIGADPTDFNTGMQNAVASGQKYAGDITEKVGEKLYGLRDVSRVVATALGLNLEELAGKVKNFFGFGEDVQKKWTEAAKLSDEAFAKNIANLQLGLTEEQKYQTALDARASLLKKISGLADEIAAYSKLEQDAGATSLVAATARKKIADATVEQRKLELQLANNETEIITATLKAEAERVAAIEAEAKSRAALAEKEVSAYNASLALEQRIAALKGEIAIKESAINQQLVTGKELEDQKNFLAGRRVELINAEAEAAKAAAEAEKKQYDARDTATAAYAKMLFEQKTTEEQLAVLQKEKIDLEKYLQALPKTSTEYLEQSVVLGDINKQIADRIQKESGVTSIIAEQNAKLREQSSIISVSGGPDAANLSTAALQGQIDKLKQALTATGSHGQQIGNSSQIGEYADWLTASNIRGQLNPLQQELDLRNEVAAYDKRYGDAATTAQYGDSVTQRSLAAFTASADKTNTVLQTISEQLKQL